MSDVPKLEPGVYTAVWRLAGAGGTRDTAGSFAFAINDGAASPALVQQAGPEDKLNPAGRVIPRWLSFTAIVIFIGAAALRLLVTAPAVRRMATDEERSAVLGASDRRLLLLAAGAILLFVPATLGDLVNRATDKDAGLGFWESIRPGAIADYLTGGPEGTLYDIRLVLTAAAVLVVVPAAAGTLRRGWQHRPQLVGRVMLASLVLGTAELVARVIPTEAPSRASAGRARSSRACSTGVMCTAPLSGSADSPASRCSERRCACRPHGADASGPPRCAASPSSPPSASAR